MSILLELAAFLWFLQCGIAPCATPAHSDTREPIAVSTETVEAS